MSEKKMTFVTVRMPSELVESIDQLAKEAVRTRSSQVIFMLKSYLEDANDEEYEYY